MIYLTFSLRSMSRLYIYTDRSGCIFCRNVDSISSACVIWTFDLSSSPAFCGAGLHSGQMGENLYWLAWGSRSLYRLDADFVG